MKLICSKENLLEGINIVQKAVSTKTTLPILEGILLEADDKLKMTGNDLEIGIECYIEADVKRKGSIVLNSKMFGDIVRRLPDAEVLMEAKENNSVIIECENSLFEIKGIAAEGFPALPSVEKENGIKISQKLIKETIRQTIFAVSLDENRPILTGSLFEYKNGHLSIVSIDGYRLALRTVMPEFAVQDRNLVIPGKTLNEISKIIQPVEEELTIYTTNNQILFDMGNCILVSRLLEGEYLNYSGIIPKDHETKITVNTKELLACFERASLVITNDERRYPVKLDIKDDMMVITSNTEIGNAREEIRLEMEGKEMEISFNPRYFIEALRVIENEVINILFTSTIGPCIIKPLQNDAFVYLILPIRK
jgi:DNA polymerase-3 subunit beta